jgi:hypothetical protein
MGSLAALRRRRRNDPGNRVAPHQFFDRSTAEQSDLEFDDSSREWRRIFAEIWGTFLVVLVVAGGDIASVKSSGATSQLMAGVAQGEGSSKQS